MVNLLARTRSAKITKLCQYADLLPGTNWQHLDSDVRTSEMARDDRLARLEARAEAIGEGVSTASEKLGSLEATVSTALETLRVSTVYGYQAFQRGGATCVLLEPQVDSLRYAFMLILNYTTCSL